MPKVEVKFSSYSGRHGAAPGDVKKVEEEEVPGLVSDGVAAPVSKAAAKQAGVDPEAAASAK